MIKKNTTLAGKSRLFLSAGLAALSFGAFSASASAQDAAECIDADSNGICDSDEAQVEAAEVAQESLIIVSGSRIARPNLDSPVPVTSIEVGELLDDGALSLGDALNDLPSLRATFSTSNSTRFIGTTGLNLLDLRGLGTTRTLTLVNGRRHVTASAGDFRVDVNTIPFELLDRVDVVTGGSSAVYGSDAIAGVVNFVLRRDFEGLEISGQNGISGENDTPRLSVSAAWGTNFADGRGNIAVVGEYTKIGELLNVQRPEISGAGIGFRAFQFSEDTSDDGFTNSDGIPDRRIRDNLIINSFSDGGTYSAFCFVPGFQTLGCDANGQSQVWRFGSDGRLFRENGIIEDFRQFGSSRVIGGGGANFGNTGTLIPNIERYNINMLAHFDVSDAFRPYAEAKYARIEATGGNSGPSFFNGFCGGLSGLVGFNTSCYDDFAAANYFISFDNAFLHPDDAATLKAIQDELLAVFGVGPFSTGFALNRNNIDFGDRTTDALRETYRFVVGVEGDIASNTRYDLSLTYGKFDARADAQNNLIVPNARKAIDAVFDGGGNIVCRVNADADPTNDDPACVPLNIFGVGAPSAEALAYVNGTAFLIEEASQLDILGYISTDSSSFFELPGGPISAVAGFEYRREKSFQEPDELSATGVTFFNAFDVFDPPTMEVVELFGELQVPVLADTPFFHELTLSGAARYSDYNSGAGLTGGVWAYNGNLVWAPVEDIRFRANYSRAVRSPTPSDLFFPLTQNFLFLNDPCDDDNINLGSGTREANCRADGVPVGFDADTISSSTGVLQGGNPFLEAETSDSYTIGAVIEPRWVPGLTITIDYYDITVNKVIANVSGNQILQQCYDAPTLDNNFCNVVNPRDSFGFLDQNEAILISPINFAKLTAEGIDADISYAKTFDNDDRLTLRLIGTHNLDRTNFLNVESAEEPNVVRGELGDPIWAANFNASYRRGDVTLSYSMRWVDKMFIGTYETTNSFLDTCPASGLIPRTDPANPGTCTPGQLTRVPPTNPDDTAEVYYPDVFYHDIRMDWRINDDFNFYVGVDNLGDRRPPFGLTGAGGGSSVYDNIGRYFFAGFNAEF